MTLNWWLFVTEAAPSCQPRHPQQMGNQPRNPDGNSEWHIQCPPIPSQRSYQHISPCFKLYSQGNTTKNKWDPLGGLVLSKGRRDPHSPLNCYFGKEEKEGISRRKGSLCSFWKYLNEALGIFFPLPFPESPLCHPA